MRSISTGEGFSPRIEASQRIDPSSGAIADAKHRRSKNGGRRPPKPPSPTREKEETLLQQFSERHFMDIKVRDSNGALLAEGDTVTLIKDLKLKGSSTVLKRGTVIKNIRLTDNADEIEGRTDKVKDLVLRTEFLKKA